jgi:hypothetical protein
MQPRIGYQDMKRLQAFPPVEKAAVLQKIAANPPTKTVVLEGHDDFGKKALKLRRDGFSLIDLQRRPRACATVWYRKRPALLRPAAGDIAMLLWETQARGEATLLSVWLSPAQRIKKNQ